MEILFTLSIALFVGLLLSRLAKVLKLPAVTAYLIAGVLIGPFCLGRFAIQGLGFTAADIEADKFKIISDVALGFIAFSIGNEFRLKDLKQFGKQSVIIGIFQAVFTTLVVDVALIGLYFILKPTGFFPLEAAVILGAVASATAPAATLMVVKQYKAHGPVTKTLLPVVAIDDAVGLVLFAVSFGIAKAMVAGEINIISILVEPILEVILSLALGAAMGYIFTFVERFFHSRSKRLAVSVAFIFLTVAISMISFKVGPVHVAFSSLLSCMMLGTIFCNICDFSAELMDRLDRWTAPIYVLFFVVSGADLKLDVFDLSVDGNWVFLVAGAAYIIFRCVGKYFGARLSADISKAEPNVRKYLGITLFPQAGVALGMAMKAEEVGGQIGATVSNIVLFSVLIYEIVGPFLTKKSLEKAGEIDESKKTSNRIRHHDKNVPTTKI